MAELTPVGPEHESTPSVPSNRRSRLVKYLKFVQKYSSYGIGAFAALHLTSTVFLPPFSIEASNSAFMLGREVYQSTIGEPIFVWGAFGAHILSGIGLRVHRVYRNFSDYGKWSLGNPTKTSISGYILTAMIAGHYYAVRWTPVAVTGDSSLVSLDYMNYSLNSHKSTQVFVFLPLMVGIFGLHSVMGGSQYSKLLRSVWKPLRFALTGVLVALAVVSLKKIAEQPVAVGWLADQYELIHNAK